MKNNGIKLARALLFEDCESCSAVELTKRWQYQQKIDHSTETSVDNLFIFQSVR